MDFNEMTEQEIRDTIRKAKKALQEKLPLTETCKITLNGKEAQVYRHGGGKYIAVIEEIDNTFGIVAYIADMPTLPDNEWELIGPAGYDNFEKFLNAVNNSLWQQYKI
ncbi:MAG: hypothetical protein WDA59_10860 [Methanofastidiosum sp.]